MRSTLREMLGEASGWEAAARREQTQDRAAARDFESKLKKLMTSLIAAAEDAATLYLHPPTPAASPRGSRVSPPNPEILQLWQSVAKNLREVHSLLGKAERFGNLAERDIRSILKKT